MAKPVILAIDDNEVNLRVIAASLSDFHVATHSDPCSAVARFEDLKPHLVILDLIMPEVDGFEICRRIRSHSELGDTPILFLSARSETDALVKGFQAGCNDYVTKPFVREELCARVRAQLRLKAAESQRLSLQQSMFLAARQLSLATLASGMSHEINNPLAILLGSIEKLQEFHPPGSDERHHLDRMERAIHRIETVVSLLRSFATVSGAETAVDLKDLIEKTAGIFRSLLAEHGADLEIDITTRNPRLRGNVENVEFVLTTLLSNAIDALAGTQEGKIQLDLYDEGENLCLSVSDTGCGMTPEQQGRLFAPFFTTKSPDRGMGLSLAVSHRIVHGLGGRIIVHSAPSTGSRFVVMFPRGNPAVISSPSKQG